MLRRQVDSGQYRRLSAGACNLPTRPLNRIRDPAMPWNEHRYPNSMKNLLPRVRSKAIDIVNALLEEGYDEGRCIRIVIWRAKRWGGGNPASIQRRRIRAGRTARSS